jgi:hypothetical protein
MKSFLIGLFGLTLFPAIGTVCWYTDHFGRADPAELVRCRRNLSSSGTGSAALRTRRGLKPAPTWGLATRVVISVPKRRRRLPGITPTSPASEKILKKLSFAFIGNVFYEPTGLMHPPYVCKVPAPQTEHFRIAGDSPPA